MENMRRENQRWQGAPSYAGPLPLNYTGPDDTNDFDDLTPDEAASKMALYSLLGQAFEEEDAEGMMGRGWLLDEPLVLVRSLVQKQAKAERELKAAVKFARLRGESNLQIAEALGLDLEEFIERHGRR